MSHVFTLDACTLHLCALRELAPAWITGGCLEYLTAVMRCEVDMHTM